MAFQVTVPPSVSAKMAKSLEETPQEEEGERTNRREDYKKVRTPFSQVPNIFAGSDHVVYLFSQKSWKRWERLELRLLWKTRRESENVFSVQKTQSQARLHFNAHFISFQRHQPTHSSVHHAGALVLRFGSSNSAPSACSTGKTEGVLGFDWVVQEGRQRGLQTFI